MLKISVVIPVYGCPGALKPLHERLTKTLKKITDDYEIILVNDGCPKNSWEEIEKLCATDKKVVGINLSRNFGQIHSTNAGMEYSSGEYVILMDCDLQDRPEAITDLFDEIKKGYDIVFVKRKDRKDSPLTMFLSRNFYKVYNSLVEGYYDPEIGNFSIATRRVVDKYNSIKESNRSYINVLSWMGYKTSTLEIEGDEREEGRSSYSFSKKINLAIDMLTSQSNKPLKLLAKFGIVIAIIAFLYLLIQVVLFIVGQGAPEGWTSIIASIFLMGGFMMASIGGVGIYVGNIFNETKGRPEYIIQEIKNDRK